MSKVTAYTETTDSANNNDWFYIVKKIGSTFASRKIKKSNILGYKSYVAFLTKNGTSNPNVTEIKNELGTITITRSSEGVFNCVATGLLNIGKTDIIFGNIFDDSSIAFGIVKVGNTSLTVNGFTFYTFDDSFNLTDVYLTNTSIEIRVYN